jgi:DNA-binding winged helix-turn-helix (wHTH) protein/tetratricopeptide (TPR) repeat protein/TolB-like protein
MPDVSVATRFGPYELRPSSRELFKFGQKLRLRPQPFHVLAVLLANAGEVVSREELHQQLWPSDTFVDFEHGLNTSIKELRAVLDDSPSEPRYIQTLPKLGYRFIFPVEPQPQLSISAPRPPQTEQQAEDPVHVPAGVVAPASQRTWLSLALAFAVVLALTVVVFRLGILRRNSPGSASASVKVRPSIAVLGFKNLSQRSDSDWMSTAMAEMLGAELASGQHMRVIASENVSRMKHDIPLAPADTFGQDTLQKIHNQLATDMIVSGSFLTLPSGSSSKLRIVLQVQDTRTGETLAAITEDGAESDLPQLISAGGDRLRRTLGIGALSVNAVREVRASIPANSEADRLYAQGLAKLQQNENLAARALIEKAIAADPNHALSHSALAECLSRLGYDSLAIAEGKKAMDLASNLDREDQLVIEGRYRVLSRDREAAVTTYQTLRNFAPDNLDYGLRLARAQYGANHANDALQTLTILRKLSEPSGSDPRIGIAEAHAAERLGDMNRSQKAAASAIARAGALGSRLILADALSVESWAWMNLGSIDKAIDDERQAHDLDAAAGDTYAAAKDTHGIGMFLEHKGDFVEARKSLEAALAEFRRAGAQWDIASCSNHLGELAQDTGDLDAARSHFEEALRIQRSLNDKRGVSADLDNLSSVELSAGRLALAQQMKEEALRGFQEIGDQRGAAITQVNLGEVLYQRGDLSAAQLQYQQAIQANRAISHKTSLAYSLVGLAEVQTAQDQLDAALVSTQESLKIREDIKEEVRIAESDVQLALIAVEQSKPAEAEALARKAAPIFEQHKSSGSASVACSALARALAAQRKFIDAHSAADRAVSLAQLSGDHMIRLQAELASAEVNIQSGKLVEAEHQIDAARRQTHREGYFAFELNARLLSAEAQLKSGHSAVASAALSQLHAEAQTRNFLLIARRANALLHP